MTYFNTTKEANVKPYIEKNRTQNEIIKGIIQSYKRPFSPKDVYRDYPIMNTPITSIRRALNTLKKQGVIVETGNKVNGLYNRPELELKFVK